MRKFDTGATRDQNDTKPDYAGFLSPLVIKGYGRYMHKHRKQADGTLRSSDNWKKGMSKSVYFESMWRHFLDVWLEHEGYDSRDGLDEALYGLLFNVMGFIHETEKENLNTSDSTIAVEYSTAPDCKEKKHFICYQCERCGRKFEGLEIVRGSDLEERESSYTTPSTDWVGSFNKMMDGIRENNEK
jgi:hypothetical protein